MGIAWLSGGAAYAAIGWAWFVPGIVARATAQRVAEFEEQARRFARAADRRLAELDFQEALAISVRTGEPLVIPTRPPTKPLAAPVAKLRADVAREWPWLTVIWLPLVLWHYSRIVFAWLHIAPARRLAARAATPEQRRAELETLNARTERDLAEEFDIHLGGDQ